MKAFKTIAEVQKTLAPLANRNAFSVLVATDLATFSHATFFYFGGWNVLPADICIEFPKSTFLML